MGVAVYGYRYYDPLTGRWPSRDLIGEEGAVNLYDFLQNDGIGDADYCGLVSISFEGGGGVGLGGWGSAEVEIEKTGECKDGTWCWRAVVNVSGNVGVILGGKVKFLGVGIDLSFTGPNISRRQTTTLTRSCDGLNYNTKIDLIRNDWVFDVSVSSEVFIYTVGISFKGGVSFGAYVDLNVSSGGVNVAIKGESAPYGGYTLGISKKGKGGSTIPVWGKARDFDTQDRREKTFFEKYFPIS